jgi:hypothetical protein
LPPARSRLYGSHIGVAIRSRTLLELRYDGTTHCLFAPYIVYRSALGQLNVIGMEMRSDLVLTSPRSVTLDVAKIQALRNTSIKFVPRADFEPRASALRGGIIVSVF